MIDVIRTYSDFGKMVSSPAVHVLVRGGLQTLQQAETR